MAIHDASEAIPLPPWHACQRPGREEVGMVEESGVLETA